MSSRPAIHLTDRVKLDLLRLIETNDLKPGDKLPTADRLCEQFSVPFGCCSERIHRRGNLAAVVGPCIDRLPTS
jgi:hypothetical protein